MAVYQPDSQYHRGLVRRLYIHNYRCLENFDLPIEGKSSILLIGNNGSGKSTVAFALEVLQKIARGTNRVDDLVTLKDLPRRDGAPMRFQIEVELSGHAYEYLVAFSVPKGSKELRIFEESLVVEGNRVFAREPSMAGITRHGSGALQISAHLAALPILQESSENDRLFIFKQWLARILILRPIPALIGGDSLKETLLPDPQVTEFGAWFTGLLAYSPSCYSSITGYLKEVIPDLKDFRNPLIGTDARSLAVQFSSDQASVSLPFSDLSDGEKCFMICALVLAANEAYGPLLCFWDEPDNYLALSEVAHFVMALRRAFESGGQFIATSHNPEAIRRFSDENTLVLSRNSHLEPTIVRRLDQIQVKGDLVNALVRGDV